MSSPRVRVLVLAVTLVVLTLEPALSVTFAQAPAAVTVGRSARDLVPLLKTLREKSSIPGVTAAIVSRGELVALGADGVRKRGSDVAITANDRMHLGSCTKAMTATLAARMVEAGELKWTTTVGDVFKDVEMRDVWRGVTLEQLLTNRSGAPGDLDAGGLWLKLQARKGTHVEQRHQLLAGVVAREPEAPPGTRFIYSNAGFAIAGHMLETLAKKPWEELIQERLFTPLGITSAGFGAPGTKGKLDQPLGHSGERAIDVGRFADNPPSIGPAGTVHMNVADWAKFVALHVDERGERTKLLKPESLAKLHTVPAGADNDYAMGWGVAERAWGGGKVITHAGSNTMWFCVTWAAPKEDFAVLVCCNSAGDDVAKTADAIAAALIEDERKARENAAK